MVIRKAGLSVALLAAGLAYGQAPYNDIHDFLGFSGDGAHAEGPIALDASGNMYGTTYSGGANNKGTVWEITASGVYKDLHDFGSVTNDGANPLVGVTLDSAGNLYGTTVFGGANEVAGAIAGGGMVWEITNAGVYEDLHDFGAGKDGYYPVAGVTLDSSGNIYGTTEDGGANSSADGETGGGNAWMITSTGTYQDLHDFGAGTDGVHPCANVTLDSAGNLYGTTIFGGANTSANGGVGGGTVWKLNLSGTYKILYSFGAGADGFAPDAAVTLDSSGDLFGTTGCGGKYGVNDGDLDPGGIVWEITSSGAYKDLHDFNFGNDGYRPVAAVTFDAAGDMFGTTEIGGPNSYGTVWEITAAGSYSILHGFGAGADGTLPNSPVTLDPAGNLYGVTPQGGANSGGMLWVISHLSGLQLNPTTVVGGVPSTGTVTLSSAAPAGGVSISLSSTSLDADVPSSVIIGAGQTTATFPITTIPYNGTVDATIGAKFGSSIMKAILTITPPAASALSLNPTTVTGGSTSTGTVKLSEPAPSGGEPVALSSSSADAKVPTSVTVPGGQTSATFTITTTSYASTVDSTITARAGSVSQTAVLTITAPVLSSESLNPTTVTGGTSSTGTVTLTGPAPSGGAVVYLSSSSGYATVPPSVTIPAGASSTTFTVTTKPYPGLYKATISAAKTGSTTQKAILTVTP